MCIALMQIFSNIQYLHISQFTARLDLSTQVLSIGAASRAGRFVSLVCAVCECGNKLIRVDVLVRLSERSHSP